MSEPTNEHVPTPQDLEREARRLARLRRLTLVGGETPPQQTDRHALVLHDPDPDPKEAA